MTDRSQGDPERRSSSGAKGEDREIPGIDRLLALTDGVVAIALTLLVLQLQVPVTQTLTEHPDSASALWHALHIDGAELTSYLVSFVVIAQFWLTHHRVLRGTRGHSEGLAWRNFAFLLPVTLMPFTSDLLGRYGSNPVATTLFGLNMAAMSLTTQWISHYAVHHDLMREDARNPHEELSGRIRSMALLAIVTLAIVVAWTTPHAAPYFWTLFILVPFLGEHIAGRIERRRETSASGRSR